jgi:hypothetical protein
MAGSRDPGLLGHSIPPRIGRSRRSSAISVAIALPYPFHLQVKSRILRKTPSQYGFAATIARQKSVRVTTGKRPKASYS